jgi:hypothetical protein
MSDIGDMGIGGFELAVIVLVFALPWMLGGAVIGAVVWHLTYRRRWWIGAVGGAALGAATGFFGMMP